MKIRCTALLAALLLAVPVSVAYAQSDEDAGSQLQDSDAAGGYATEDAVDNEDASWAAGTTFDGSPASGEVQDPSTLEPHPFEASPNE